MGFVNSRSLTRAAATRAAVAFAAATLAPPAFAGPPARRHHFEFYAGLGIGNAVCDSNKPANECPVDPGAGPAFDLGAAFRFIPNLAVGLEAGGWGFRTREAWRGNLPDPATKVNFTAAYFTPFLRWYWLKHGRVDPFLQAGAGFSSIGAAAENNVGKYDARYNGVAVHLGIGVEWWVSQHWRVGTQGMLYLHRTARVCETTNNSELCRDAGKDESVLAWRIMIVQLTLGLW